MRYFMPARNIGNKTSSLSGVYNTSKSTDSQYYESSLERDFLYLVEFDPMVSSFQTQPITIEYVDQGKNRKYTPDILVKYVGLRKGFNRKNLLVEIKYRDDLKKNWKELKPKFLAAMRYADSQNWRFKILTEVEIRTNYLENVKFLIRYKNASIDIGLVKEITDCLNNLIESTPNEIITACSRDKNRQAELIPALWFLVSNFFIGCNLYEKLNMNSSIWTKN